MASGVGCFVSSAITLLVSSQSPSIHHNCSCTPPNRYSSLAPSSKNPVTDPKLPHYLVRRSHSRAPRFLLPTACLLQDTSRRCPLTTIRIHTPIRWHLLQRPRQLLGLTSRKDKRTPYKNLSKHRHTRSRSVILRLYRYLSYRRKHKEAR